MTKQIEDYPERWLSALCKERTGMSLNKFKQEYYCDFTPEKMLIDTNEYREMQQQIDSLTEQNKELQDRKENACSTFVKAIEYAINTEGGMDWLREWLNAATYEELVEWGWEDTPKDVFIGLIELNKESK